MRTRRPRARIYAGENLDVMRRLFDAGERAQLAYLDPPFCTGREFVYRPASGGEAELAFSDRWPSFEAYLSALRERVVLVRDVLSPDGTAVVHVDPETSHYVKVMLDGVFGRACFRNEIVWRYRRWGSPTRDFQKMHDVLLRYVRDPREPPRWSQLFEPRSETTRKRFGDRRVKTTRCPERGTMLTSAEEERSPGVFLSDVWEIPLVAGPCLERTGYPTQKPEALLERVVSACSYPGDLVLDPYAGSGTAIVVAERLGRRAIGIDASPVAVRVAASRLRSLSPLPSY